MIIELNGFDRGWRRPTNYILNEAGEPVACEDTLVWAHWIEKPGNKVLKQTHIGPVMVSTVFLGIDHNWSNQGAPILWESMVFGWAGPWTDYAHRYNSRQMAEKDHERICREVRDYLRGWRLWWSYVMAGVDQVQRARRWVKDFFGKFLKAVQRGQKVF